MGETAAAAVGRLIKRQTLWDMFKLIIGTFLLAGSLSLFFDPMGYVIGGATGVGIIIKELGSKVGLSIPLYLSNFLINTPLIILGFMVKGKRFIGRTLLSTVLLSLFLYLTQNIVIGIDDSVLVAVFGGVLAGAGTGMVISASATTGGSDLLAAILQEKFKHLPVMRILFAIDSCIVAGGAFVFGIKATLYAIIAVYITSAVGDRVVEGFHHSKAVFVITSQWETVAQRILKELERGVTGLESEGMYTGEKRKVLYCVVSVKELVKLKNMVYKEDPKAFVIVTDAREVLGEGFLPYE